MEREKIPRRVETEEQARSIQPPYTGPFYARRTHDPTWCCASVPDGGRSVSFRQCGRKPKHWYGELGYCNQHDPNFVLDERDRREREYRAKRDRYQAHLENTVRRRQFLDACEVAVREIAKGHNDPMTLCRALLQKYKENGNGNGTDSNDGG
jgi:hypothetical protein